MLDFYSPVPAACSLARALGKFESPNMKSIASTFAAVLATTTAAWSAPAPAPTTLTYSHIDANEKSASAEGAPWGFFGAENWDFEQLRLALADHALADDEPSAPRSSPQAAMVTHARTQKLEEVDRERATGKVVKVFRPEQLLAALNISEISSGDLDQKKRVAHTIHRIIELGTDRMLATPGPAWQGELDEIREVFPTFSRAIEEVVRPSLAILSAGGVARPAPLLLVGSPEAGKSFFATTLSSMLKAPVVRMDMSSTTMGCTLSGLGPHWANSGPGEVFRTLAFGRAGVAAVANPVFVLDEIDKAGGDQRFDPIGPLHALLEESSAQCFEDESLPGIAINAGYIQWVLTANTTSTISRPILSRVHVVHVPELSEIELLHVRARIFSGVVDSLGIIDFEDWIPPSVLRVSGGMGPREFKTRSVMAIGKALARGKYRVSENDFQSGLSARVKRMGFI